MTRSGTPGKRAQKRKSPEGAKDSSWGRLSTLPIRGTTPPRWGWGMLMHPTGGSEASAPATALRPVGAKISLVNLTHGVLSVGGQGRGLSYFAPYGAASLRLIDVGQASESSEGATGCSRG